LPGRSSTAALAIVKIGLTGQKCASCVDEDAPASSAESAPFALFLQATKYSNRTVSHRQIWIVGNCTSGGDNRILGLQPRRAHKRTEYFFPYLDHRG
jgi:hypothetical protein